MLFNLDRDRSSPGETHPTGKPTSILLCRKRHFAWICAVRILLRATSQTTRNIRESVLPVGQTLLRRPLGLINLFGPTASKFDHHRVYRLWACVCLLWCYRYPNTTAVRRGASGTTVGSGSWYFDPLVLEFLADLLTDPNAQPPPNWNTARACS